MLCGAGQLDSLVYWLMVLDVDFDVQIGARTVQSEDSGRRGAGGITSGGEGGDVDMRGLPFRGDDRQRGSCMRRKADASFSRAFVPPWSHTIVADRSRTRRRCGLHIYIYVRAAPGTLAVIQGCEPRFWCTRLSVVRAEQLPCQES